MAYPETVTPDQTTASPPAEQPRDAGRPAPTRWRVKIPGAVRDVVLVVLGAALALAADEWRESRQRAQRGELALAAIRAELQANLGRVERARAHHLRVRDTLRVYVARGQPPPSRVYFEEGLFKPAFVSATAWEAAREAGVLNELPYALVLRIAPTYEIQARYRALADGLLQRIMGDALSLGAESVFRDRAAQFAVLAEDFSNREFVLEREYREALAALPAAAATARR